MKRASRYDIAPFTVEEPQTGRKKRVKGDQYRLEDVIEQKISRGRLSDAFGADCFCQKNVGTTCSSITVGEQIVGRTNESGAAGRSSWEELDLACWW